ncbi:hypothetical protein [Paraurantiacibacter namhicola]|uniref:Glycerophosphoryl diester phosphodiesterase membrane domain-containing protein n=1 Tax=Paraurantiacibacter namhicola TaxID=645517 RepID=A0A1C7DA12_9SPHN|nr:hypothetical protein [Paraurantiacibacter namhicola]ANU08212.1 hypothetical protein A6F65_01919 [Paraurantiacibacter namhicola]
MEHRELDVGRLLATIWQLTKENIGAVLLTGGILVALGMIVDIYFFEEWWADFTYTISQFVIGYILSRRLAIATGLMEEPSSTGFGEYFGLSVIFGIGTTLAGLLLLIPGILLTVKWMLAFPALFDDNKGLSGTEPLSESWELTRGPTFWRLLAAYLVSLLLVGVTFLAYWNLPFEENAAYYGILAAGQVALAGSVIYTILLGYASYLELRDDSAEAAEVFA